MDLTNLVSKTVRAIRFYLVNSGAAPAGQCFHQFDYRERNFATAPIVDVTTIPIGPEVQFTGDDEIRVMITIGFSAVNQADVADAEAQRVAFDKQVGQVRQAMMLTTDQATLNESRNRINAAAYLLPLAETYATGDSALDDKLALANADMDDFTLLKLIPDVYGTVRMPEVNWSIGMAFRVTACESKIAEYT